MRKRIDHAPSACSGAATPSRINVAADATRISSIECSDHTLDARIEMRFRPETNAVRHVFGALMSSALGPRSRAPRITRRSSAV